MKILRTVKELRKQIRKWREAGKTMALVPTMGALHDGHLSLVRLAKKKADKVAVSIFVNPTQFAPTEDLASYPRDEEGDLAKLAAEAVDLVWLPGVDEMYPQGFSTHIVPGSAALGLEGAIRPHHFGGVATVCCKLFSQVTPDVAIFGEKDYQQLIVLKQMVRDLNLPLKIIGGRTERADDGLALSSRNAYLTEAERKCAPSLHAVIAEIGRDVAQGADIKTAVTNGRRKLLAAGFSAVDYIEVRHAETLDEVASIEDGPLRVLAAARLGKTRLIDNLAAEG